MLLGGDLGGTKTLLALAEQDAGGIRIVRQQRYVSADYANFETLLAEFLVDRSPVTAAAHGLPLLAAEQIVTLHDGQPLEHAPRVILGAGTGLGVAGLVWQGDRYRVIAGEGGHIGFAPQSTEQGELWRWLLAQNGRVTTEDIVSGPGLARIYAFSAVDRAPKEVPLGCASRRKSAPPPSPAAIRWRARRWTSG